MRIGVVVPMSLSDGSGQVPTWPQVRTFGQHAEAVGLHSLWVCDHLLSGPPDDRAAGIHEGWTILAALLAKMATTADTVSGGRLLLGLGAGWYDPEYRAFGYPTDHRVGRFEEAIAIIGPLVRGEQVTVAGRYYQVREAVLRPPPDRPIPILVAAKGRRMLRLTARSADAWNTAWYGLPDELLRRRLAELHAALEAEGRDPATLRRTVGMEVRDPDASDPGEDLGAGFGGSVDELARAIDAHQRLGFDDLIVQLEPKTTRSLDRLAEALELRTH
jgi:alkanesulfonate monooxygenase SsuD/methylene tetrahydromethanopterin reductase-like flavin-dependent oxidoreductase (luciferase family)